MAAESSLAEVETLSGTYEYDDKVSIQLELPVFDKEPMVPITELMKPQHSVR